MRNAGAEANYIFREGIDSRYPVETDENDEINVGHTMELFEEILGNEGDDIVASGFDAIGLGGSFACIFNRGQQTRF